MGWLETQGALLRQLRGVLERDGWEAMVTSYGYIKYRKAGRMVSCRIAPYRYTGRPSIVGYWVTFIIPLKYHPRHGERNKLRRFRTAIDKDIDEEIVLSKIESLFGDEEVTRLAQVILGKQLTCLRCGHRWVPRKSDVRTCANPKCRSIYWDIPRAEKKSELANH